MILLETGAISRDGFNGPYSEDTRQEGFVQYGNSHVLKLIGTGEMAQRSSWYQKWNVHLFPRPEVRFYHIPPASHTISVVRHKEPVQFAA